MALFDNMPAGGMEQLKAALMTRQAPRPGGLGGAMMGNIPPEMQQRLRSLPMFGDLFAQMFARGNPTPPAQSAPGGQPAPANTTTTPPTPYTQYFSVPGRTISEAEYNQMQQNQPQQPALATPDTPSTPTPAAQTAPQQPMAQPGQAATMGGNPYFMRRHPFAGVYS